ncbi:MAG: hypothetical protein MO846_01530 [Candidatus Devosia symbiotica]|nr:hypothetical protein [Candidatus Devosia symbiotica]
MPCLWFDDRIDVAPARMPISGFGAWRRDFLVVMINPKAALMWSAIATFRFGTRLGNIQMLAFGPVVTIFSTDHLWQLRTGILNQHCHPRLCALLARQRS